MPFKRISLFVFFYIVITALQYLASIDGLIHILGLHWIFAGFAAILLFLVPALGPATGFYGAIVVWKWPIIPVLFLFFWPYFVYGALVLFGSARLLMYWKNTIWPFYSGKRFRFRKDDIEPEFNVKENASTDQTIEAHAIE
ncbi:MAG: hypothetical protein J5716_04865, partial [Alphaproteobacteria bacterium]|nr:hypothetical protein [Alphaproteobacteria bacterium]